MKYFDENPGLKEHLLIVLVIDIALAFCSYSNDGSADLGIFLFLNIPFAVVCLLVGLYLGHSDNEFSAAPWIANIIIFPILQLSVLYVGSSIYNHDEDGDVVYEFTYDKQKYCFEYEGRKWYNLYLIGPNGSKFTVGGQYRGVIDDRILTLDEYNQKTIYDSIPEAIESKTLYVRHDTLFGLFKGGVKFKKRQKTQMEIENGHPNLIIAYPDSTLHH